MLAVARAYFASEADAEDAVQDAVVRAYRALDQLADGGRFAAWLARITVNTCLNILAARSDRVSLAQFASTVKLHRRLRGTTLTPASFASKGEEAELLKAAVGRLPEEQRVVLMLRYETLEVDTSLALLARLMAREDGADLMSVAVVSGSLSALDPFRIWFWLVVITGLSATAQLPGWRAWVTCSLCWLVAAGTRCGLVVAAAQSATAVATNG